MSPRVVGRVIAVALVGVLFAVVATSGGIGLWVEPTWNPSMPAIEPVEIDLPDRPADTSQPEPSSEPAELPGWIESIVQVLLIGVGLAAVVALAVWAWTHRPRARWRGRSVGRADFEVLPDVAAAIVDEAAAQRAALLTGAPRNAIVRCWLHLERDVAAAGLVRDPSDTSADFTERVLARYTVDTDAIQRLGALYREARFSEHDLGESSRGAAVDALDRLHRALEAGVVDRASADGDTLDDARSSTGVGA